MCGIAGIIGHDTHTKSNIKKMLGKLAHRGPDGEGIWSNSQVTLGMRRLSIIDLATGMQPLFNEDNSIVIVGNGEIYNYKKLNKQIIAKGHHPKTGSDIETIIHLYEEYGSDCISKLTGMFAFALYDIKNNTVLIARDRLGEKPLYYSDYQQSFYFASELKALTAVVPHDKIDLDSVNLYFYYYYVPEPRTMFPNISKLAAGHYLTLDLKTMRYQIVRYWDPTKCKPVKFDSPIKKFRETLETSIENTLVADVEVGVSLSGGLDSSAILAIAASRYPQKMKAFTIGYNNTPPSDERSLAHIVTEKYGVEHIQMEVSTKDVVDHFPQLVYDGDDPIADIAGHAIYSVSRLAHKHGLKVLLGGLGGDELFWGYEWVRQATLYNSQHNDFHFYDMITPYKQAKSFIGHLTSKSFKSILDQELPYNIFKPPRHLGITANARYSQDLIRDIWLVSNCIAYNDRLSMASSVELRSPLLNHQLVETAYISKRNTLSYNSPSKYWFKKIIASLLPKEIISAPKRGFQPPVIKWFFALIYQYIHLLKNGYLVKNNILDKKSIDFMVHTWVIRPLQWPAIYQLITLEIWAREYVWDQNPGDLQ